MAKAKKTQAAPSSDTMSLDSYESMFTGLSRVSDHTAGVTPGRGLILSDLMLSNIYASDGIGSRIIKLLPHDMVKNGYRIAGDNDDILIKELKKINNTKHTLSALNWMRTYGGSITVVGVDDGRTLDKPMGNNYTKVQWMRSVARPRISVNQMDLVVDPTKPDFGEYEYYTINFGNLGGSGIKVHKSRCLVYKGLEAPDDPMWYQDMDTQYWGLSAMQPIWGQLKQLGASFQGMAHLMMELVIGKYKLKDLSTLISSPNAELIVKRLELINQSKSIINGVVLDAESEDYIREMVNVSGTDKILEQLMIMLSAASGYPVTILFGRSPDGMNATGASDLSNYDSLVQSSQETILENPQQKLINIVNKYKKVKAVEAEPVLKFNPVRTPPMLDLVKSMETIAKIDQIYNTIGTHTTKEIAEMRFVNGYDMMRMDITGFTAHDAENLEVPAVSEMETPVPTKKKSKSTKI